MSSTAHGRYEWIIAWIMWARRSYCFSSHMAIEKNQNPGGHSGAIYHPNSTANPAHLPQKCDQMGQIGSAV